MRGSAGPIPLPWTVQPSLSPRGTNLLVGGTHRIQAIQEVPLDQVLTRSQVDGPDHSGGTHTEGHTGPHTLWVPGGPDSVVSFPVS